MPELVEDSDSEDEEYLPPPPRKASETITIASSGGTSTLDCRFPCSVDGIQTEALYDTGALRSCISKALYDILPSPPPLRPLATRVVSATGGTLQPVGEVDLKVRMGRFLFAQRFIVCSLLIAPMVIGNDMQFRYQMGQGWKDERFAITTGDAVVVAAILSKAEPYLTTARQTVVPARTISNVWTEGRNLSTVSDPKALFCVEPARESNLPPGICIVLALHVNVQETNQPIPVTIVNSTDEDFEFPEQAVLATLQPPFTEVDVCAISTDRFPVDPPDKQTMTSPADTPKPEKPLLADYPATEKTKATFEKLCADYQDIFTKSATDIGHTQLITMDINTGDSPPIAQPPYQTALKHMDWLQEELQKLEEAGVIEKCVSPWASPIVIVPRKVAPGQPPKK